MNNAGKKPVVVVGVGDFARIARYYLEHDSEHPVVAHALSAALLETNEFIGLPLVAFEELSQR
ncbi:MAG TPA: transferase, partial [Thermoanaerobaculia bacterium]